MLQFERIINLSFSQQFIRSPGALSKHKHQQTEKHHGQNRSNSFNKQTRWHRRFSKDPGKRKASQRNIVSVHHEKNTNRFNINKPINRQMERIKNHADINISQHDIQNQRNLQDVDMKKSVLANSFSEQEFKNVVLRRIKYQKIVQQNIKQKLKNKYVRGKKQQQKQQNSELQRQVIESLPQLILRPIHHEQFQRASNDRNPNQNQIKYKRHKRNANRLRTQNEQQLQSEISGWKIEQFF